MPFWWEWQLALYMLSDFPGSKNLSGLNDLNSLNNLSGLNDLYSLISSENLYFKVKMYIFDGLLLFITWKRPLKSFWANLLCPFSLIYLSGWLDHPWHPNDQYWPLFVEWIIKIPFFTDIWYPFCRRLLRPAGVTFLKTDWRNSNVQTSWSHKAP